ncbi:hypothetical protein Pmani_003058 [Petrolisthes manimaculis]|uniref:Uncharacterized protein n=1 Tax=Petrolisthes manimaculis TaxID=1843537 RepID=A0AAE1QHI4_9EUCA|nr:hypothetical protein Pmani_003058 [Petrolisthes manimaculis]
MIRCDEVTCRPGSVLTHCRNRHFVVNASHAATACQAARLSQLSVISSVTGEGNSPPLSGSVIVYIEVEGDQYRDLEAYGLA